MYLGFFLIRNNIIYPDKIALKFNDKSYTYSKLQERVYKLRNALSKLGFSRGDRIAFLGYNDLHFIEFLLGIPKAGFVAVPLNYRLSSKELSYILNDSNCKGLIYSSQFAKLVDEIKKELNFLRHYIFFGNEIENIAGCYSYEELISQCVDEKIIEPDENDLAFILYTSGTTGFPKGAVLTHRNMNAAINHIIIEYEIVPEKIYLNVCPLFHVAPIQIICAYLTRGCTCIVTSQFEPKTTLEIIKKEGVTDLFIVPTMLRSIINTFKTFNLNKNNILTISTITYGGAPTPYGLIKESLEIFGSVFLQVYGSTEAGLVTVLRKQDHEVLNENGEYKLLKSCGHMITNVLVKIINEEGNELGPYQIGEIIIKSESVMHGYWENLEETKKIKRNGWLYTGDIGYLDDNGYLYIVDRKKDLIISGGENIYPAEIENVLLMMPQIQEVAVIGIPDEHWGEMVKAIIVLKEGETLNINDVLDFCKDRLASYKKPKSVEFVNELPKSATGKILKRVLKELYTNKNKD